MAGRGATDTAVHVAEVVPSGDDCFRTGRIFPQKQSSSDTRQFTAKLVVNFVLTISVLFFGNIILFHRGGATSGIRHIVRAPGSDKT